MNITIKSKIPFLFLVAISIWWGFYYQSNSSLNDYGAANFEWLYLIDGLIVLPILCFFCIKDKKEALLKSLVLISLAIWLGSFIIPEQSKLIWQYLETGRYFLVAVLLLLEVVAIMTVYLAIKSALNKQDDPDIAIEKPIKQFLGDSIVAKLLNFETRMWTYALFAKRIKTEQFNGQQHFSYHLKDGAQSNLQGFVIIIAFEMPFVHLLLHFLWSPLAANIITLLTVFSLIFFIAEYRALSRRPISLVGDALVIRYGIYQPMTIPLSNIESISRWSEPVKRSKTIKQYNYFGVPNVAIDLVKPDGNVKTIYLGIDSAHTLIQAVQEAKTQYNPA